MSEIVCAANYNDGMNSFQAEKEVSEHDISIVVYDVRGGRRLEKYRLSYQNISREYASPFLSWHNLIFCSNNYGASPDYDYMHHAVQNGKKTAATVYLSPDSEEGINLVRNLPTDCDALPYGVGMLYVFHKGHLSDFFDYAEIRAIYEKHGVQSVDWDKVKDYFERDMAFFGNEKDCGFSLQSGGDREQTIITGLLLGYPIESTIAWMH